MPPPRRPVSLVAERAVRVLRESAAPVDSCTLARTVLATRTADEPSARRLLETAFGNDGRLVYRDDGWSLTEPAPARPRAVPPPTREPDRVVLLVDGQRPGPRRRFELHSVTAVRLQGDEVIDACGGDPVAGPAGSELREEFLRVLDRAVPVVHDLAGSLPALEGWLEEPLPATVSLRELARDRLGLPSGHDVATLAARLELQWTDGREWSDRVAVLDACLEALRHPDETLEELCRSTSAAPPIPWSRYEFDREFLRTIPRVAGTYHFYDAEGELIYIGKSGNLHRRIASYFREGRPRTSRVQKLVDRLRRIEYEPLQSDLEAMMQEAVQIARRRPTHNVQRRIHVRGHHRSRMRSIMILEPAAPPNVFRAYLVRDGRLIDKIGIGPRGGGLHRLQRVLDDHFFLLADGPTVAPGPDVDVEVMGRWLAEHRDTVVAFDPTSLRSAEDVVLRLRALLESRELFEPDGSPILFH